MSREMIKEEREAHIKVDGGAFRHWRNGVLLFDGEKITPEGERKLERCEKEQGGDG